MLHIIHLSNEYEEPTYKKNSDILSNNNSSSSGGNCNSTGKK